MRRAALLPASALVGGLQLALLNPVVGLVLQSLYGASAAQIGLVLALMNATGFLAAIVIPGWADRRGEYLSALLVCGALTLLTAVLLSLTSSLALAAIVLVLLAGPAGTWSALLFAHQRAGGGDNETLIRTRAVFSFAWVAGPPLATGVMTGFGDRWVLVLIAGVALANVLLTLAMQRQGRAAARTEDGANRTEAAPAPSAPALAVRPAVLVSVTLAITALQAANAGSVTAMSLLVSQRLGLDAVWAGTALGLCAVLEIPALLLVGRLTRRFTSLALLIAGTVCSVLYYGAVGFSPSPLLLLALQVPNALGIAALSGVGLTWFQEVIARPGLASGTFMNARRIGAIISGPVIATGGATDLGYTLPYALFAGLSVLALAGILLARAVAGRSPAETAS